MLATQDHWFYSSTSGVHPPYELRNMWETSIGHNTAVIIDFAPFPNGSLPVEQVEVGEGWAILSCHCPVASPQSMFLSYL